LAGDEARRHRDKRADERAVADRDPVLAEDRPGGKRHDRAVPEPPEQPPGGRSGGHDPGPLELPPPPVHRLPHKCAPRAPDPSRACLPRHHQGILSRPSTEVATSPYPAQPPALTWRVEADPSTGSGCAGCRM